MALPATVTAAQLTGNAIARLVALRKALSDVDDLYGWTSGVALADLQAIGLDATTAQAILSAVADARALSLIYNTGLPPASYPQPPSAYPYGASQRTMIGPQ